jgi:hypothetical protein
LGVCANSLATGGHLPLDIFSDRTEMSKTLIAFQDGNHAEKTVEFLCKELGKDNDVTRKIIYALPGSNPALDQGVQSWPFLSGRMGFH